MIFELLGEYFVQEAIPEFVRKLYLTLESSKYQNIVTWTLDDRALEIHQPSILQSQVLPTVFKQKTLNSFIRQLNLYGFKKLQKGNTKKMVFYHPFFKRNQIQSLIFIMRKRRGYHDPRQLFNIETKEFKDRHNSFCRGIMTKIEHNIQTLKEKCPTLYQSVISLTKSYTSKKHHSLKQEEETKNQSQIPSIPSLSSISQFSPIPPPEIYFYPMMTSIPCFMGGEMMIPMMASIISLPDN